MHNMQISEEVAGILEASFRLAGNAHFEYITPELLLYVTCQNPSFAKAFENCGGSLAELDRSLKTYLEEYMQPGAGKHAKPQMSQGTAGLLDAACDLRIDPQRFPYCCILCNICHVFSLHSAI